MVSSRAELIHHSGRRGVSKAKNGHPGAGYGAKIHITGKALQPKNTK
jgi:hypothetical protein